MLAMFPLEHIPEMFTFCLRALYDAREARLTCEQTQAESEGEPNML